MYPLLNDTFIVELAGGSERGLRAAFFDARYRA